MTTIYVNPTHPAASDSNAGTDPALPLLTLGGTAGKFTTMDKIIIAGGAVFLEAWTPTPAVFGGTLDPEIPTIIEVDVRGVVWPGQVGRAAIVDDTATALTLSANTALHNELYQGFNTADGTQKPAVIVRDLDVVSHFATGSAIDVAGSNALQSKSGFLVKAERVRMAAASPGSLSAAFRVFKSGAGGNNPTLLWLDSCVVRGAWAGGANGGDPDTAWAIFTNSHVEGELDGSLVGLGNFNVLGVASTFRGRRFDVGANAFNYSLYGCLGDFSDHILTDGLAPTSFDAQRCLFVYGLAEDEALNGVVVGVGSEKHRGHTFPFAPSDIPASVGAQRFDWYAAQTGAAFTLPQLNDKLAGLFPVAWPGADITGTLRGADVDAGAVEGALALGDGGDYALVTGIVLTGEGVPDVGATVSIQPISASPPAAILSHEPVELIADSEGRWTTRMLKGGTYLVRMRDSVVRRWLAKTVLVGTADAQIFETMESA